MTHIIFDGQHIELNDGQSVLSALLEREYDIPNSCQSGVCQSCIMQAVDGNVPVSAQVGLKDTFKDQGYFLACSCQPKTPLQVVKVSDKALRYSATVVVHELLSADVLRLRLQTQSDFSYRAGQFIHVWKNQSLSRSYSLASVEGLDDYLELHIRRVSGGKLSNWLHDDIKEGDRLQILSAAGNCFYVSGNINQKILLAGTGTGLAPVIGIARDAIKQGHQGEIHLLHGARRKSDLYLHQTLVEMSKQYPQFFYHANVLEFDDAISLNSDASVLVSTLPIEQQVVDITLNPADWKVYLCGDDGIVNALKKKLFLSGVNMKNIYADPFVKSRED